MAALRLQCQLLGTRAALSSPASIASIPAVRSFVTSPYHRKEHRSQKPSKRFTRPQSALDRLELLHNERHDSKIAVRWDRLQSARQKNGPAETARLEAEMEYAQACSRVKAAERELVRAGVRTPFEDSKWSQKVLPYIETAINAYDEVLKAGWRFTRLTVGAPLAQVSILRRLGRAVVDGYVGLLLEW